MSSLKKSQRSSNRTLRKKRSPQSGGYNRDSGKNFISVNTLVIPANIISTPRPDISSAAFIREGTLFNCGVIWHRHRDVEYYIGVGRSLTKLGDGVDRWTGTDITNTTAGNEHSAWGATQWNGIDRPYLFIIEKNRRYGRRHARFFGMNCYLQDYERRHEIGQLGSNLEDPRIALCEGILCFFAHTPYGVPGGVSERGMAIPGAGPIDLPGVPGAPVASRMKPVISWVAMNDINSLIDGYFGHGRTHAQRADAVAASGCTLRNADWRPLCANFVDRMDKNWAIIPRADATSNRPGYEGERRPAFDFLCQWGFFGAQSVVVIRHYLDDMVRHTGAAGGLDNRYHGRCDLTQSVGGWKFRRIGAPQFSQSATYNVPTNNRIRALYDYIRETCHRILGTFIRNRLVAARGAAAPAAANSPWWRARGQRGDPDRFKFDIILEAGNRFRVKYPFITSRRVDLARELKSTVSRDPYTYDLAQMNPYVIGISTGGTMCQIGEDLLGVGHLKLHNELAYAVYVACLWYSENQAHRDADFADHHTREFLEFLVSDDSIFKRIYNFFQSQEVYKPDSTYYLPYAAGVDVRRRNRDRNVAHSYLTYSSFLFTMERRSYKIKKISAQFFFGVNPCNPGGGPRAQLLQFAHSIDVNGDTYIIGFGDNDARSWIGKMSTRIGNSLLAHPKVAELDLAHPPAEGPAIIDAPPDPVPDDYYKRLARKFLSYCIILSDDIEQ